MKKQAILIASVGTTHHESQLKTIDAIQHTITNAYPNHSIYHAWTGQRILSRLRSEGRTELCNVNEIMEQIIRDQIIDLTVQPTYVIRGMEYNQMQSTISAFQEHFNSLHIGAPLLNDATDYVTVAKEIVLQFPSIQPDTLSSSKSALVLFGHGTSHHADSAYMKLSHTFHKLGYQRVLVGTLQENPPFNTLLERLQHLSVSHIFLAPLMIAVGRHVLHDIAGDNSNSLQVRFEQAGYSVDCIMKGLGEYEGIRNLYVQHIRNSISNE